MNASAISEAFGTLSLIMRGAEKYRALSGIVFAWMAVIIYAASNSVVALLVGIGEELAGETGRNAITYSNLLLLGSLISLVPLSLMFRRDLNRETARALDRRDWVLMTVSAFLSSALTPGLFFYALSNTTVTNVVLITRIEPPLFLLAALFLLNERFRARAMLASLVALMGAVVIIGWRENGGVASLGKGEWAAIAATVSYVASTIVTRRGLRNVPLGFFSVYRTIVGAAVYFIAVSLIFGPGTFRDIFSPMLWSWVWVYTGIVIVLGQVTWAMALKFAQSSDLTLATSFSPLAGLLFAMVLLGETPGPGLLPGAAIIMLSIMMGRGMFSGQADAARPEREGAASGAPACAWPLLLRSDVCSSVMAQPAPRVPPPRSGHRKGRPVIRAPIVLRHALTPICAGAPPG